MMDMSMLMKFLKNKGLNQKSLFCFIQQNQGFTLLEVILAMAILVVAFGSILTLESGSLNASLRAQQMNIVAMLAKNQMIETEYQLEGKKFDEIKKEESGNFEPPYDIYHWKTVIKEIEMPNLLNGVKQSSLENSTDVGQNSVTEMIGKRMSEFLSKAIREVTITISWKRGLGEQNFSVSTYWVNLNHELNLMP